MHLRPGLPATMQLPAGVKPAFSRTRWEAMLRTFTPKFVSLTTPGATVQLDRVTDGHDIYTEVKIVGRHANLGQITDGDPRYRYRDRVAAALRTGEFLLDVLLGNGAEPDL